MSKEVSNHQQMSTKTIKSEFWTRPFSAILPSLLLVASSRQQFIEASNGYGLVETCCRVSSLTAQKRNCPSMPSICSSKARWIRLLFLIAGPKPGMRPPSKGLEIQCLLHRERLRRQRVLHPARSVPRYGRLSATAAHPILGR